MTGCEILVYYKFKFHICSRVKDIFQILALPLYYCNYAREDPMTPTVHHAVISMHSNCIIDWDSSVFQLNYNDVVYNLKISGFFCLNSQETGYFYGLTIALVYRLILRYENRVWIGEFRLDVGGYSSSPLGRHKDGEQ